jgi:predicted ATPase
MISRVQALNYRCLRYTDRPMGAFHVLIGPNASGKSTFLDAIAFLGRLVSDGLETAVLERSRNFQDLVWQRTGTKFELAIEADIPREFRDRLGEQRFSTVRYEVAVGTDAETKQIGLLEERVSFWVTAEAREATRELFPQPVDAPPTIVVPRLPKGTKTIIKKVPGGNDNFYAETGKSYNPSFKLGPLKSALGNLPADETSFPVSNWLRQLLLDGVQPVFLDSFLLREASWPGQGRKFKTDGSNLPWVVEHLKASNEGRFREWIKHVQTALPDLEDVRVVQRDDDKHAYLMLCYRGGLQVPSWVASDGTMRMLALTLPAYLPDMKGVYLIEEPENGIHPKAVEPIFQSLSSVYDAQVLLASHSPVILSLVEPKQVLCFAKHADSGATDIVSGDKHPALREWRGTPQFAVLFGAGVLS